MGVPVPQGIVGLGGPGLEFLFSRLQGQDSGPLPLSYFPLLSVFPLLTSVVRFLGTASSPSVHTVGMGSSVSEGGFLYTAKTGYRYSGL